MPNLSNLLIALLVNSGLGCLLFSDGPKGPKGPNVLNIAFRELYAMFYLLAGPSLQVCLMPWIYQRLRKNGMIMYLSKMLGMPPSLPMFSDPKRRNAMQPTPTILRKMMRLFVRVSYDFRRYMFCIGNPARLQLRQIVSFPGDSYPIGISSNSTGGFVVLSSTSLFFMNSSAECTHKNDSAGISRNHGVTTFPNGDLATIDYRNSIISVVRSDSHPLFSCRVVLPSGIIVSPDGSKIFIFTRADGIMVFNATGNFEFLFQIGTIGSRLGNFRGDGHMVFDKDGNLIVSDSDNCRIQVISILNIDQPARRSFEVVKVFYDSQLKCPLDIALSSDQSPILVTICHRISRISLNEKLDYPRSFPFLLQGDLVLFDYNSVSLIRVIDLGLVLPRCITITSEGKVVVCNSKLDQVFILEFGSGQEIVRTCVEPKQTVKVVRSDSDDSDSH